jgi:hypothetical protein
MRFGTINVVLGSDEVWKRSSWRDCPRLLKPESVVQTHMEAKNVIHYGIMSDRTS